MSDLQEKVLSSIGDKLGDIERSAMQALLGDSNELVAVKDELEKSHQYEKRLERDIQGLKNSFDPLQKALDELKDRCTEHEERIAELEKINRKFEVTQAKAMLDMAMTDKNRVFDILDRQNRFFNQTTSRQVIVDGGEMDSHYMNGDGTYAKLKAPDIAETLTDTKSLNDGDDTAS